MNTINKILYNLFFAIIVACNTNAEADDITLCEKGYYLYKCGDNVVGPKWLQQQVAIEGNLYLDYYDYSEQNNIQNLQKWFEGEGFTYVNSSNITKTLTAQTVKTNRDGKLQYFCNPTTKTITCEKCPGYGTTKDSSIVTIDNEGKLSNWRVYSKVNCYIDTFFDEKGSYEYKANDETQKCYYTDI